MAALFDQEQEQKFLVLLRLRRAEGLISHLPRATGHRTLADDQEVRVGQCRPQLQDMQRRAVSGRLRSWRRDLRIEAGLREGSVGGRCRFSDFLVLCHFRKLFAAAATFQRARAGWVDAGVEKVAVVNGGNPVSCMSSSVFLA